MKKLLYILFFFSTVASAQYTLDTTNMKAWSTTYMNTGVYGRMSNGHFYNASFVMHYFNGNTNTPDSIEVVRADLTNHTTTSKIMQHPSGIGMIWRTVFDSLGQFYIGMANIRRDIWKFNFKDSIYFENLGNGFSDGVALAYSMALGSDNHVYFGGSSGPASTSWCEYNPYTKTLTTHPEFNSQQGYVLTIAGASDWVYGAVGQSPNELWAVRKSDNYKKLLFSISGAYRFNLGSSANGNVYLNYGTDVIPASYYKLVNGDTVVITLQEYSTAPRGIYHELDASGDQTTPNIQSIIYDEASQQLFYTINNGALDSVTIISDHVSNFVRRIYSFPNDTSRIYYTGDYYGVTYEYTTATKEAIPLGSIGYNLYSTVAVSDSIMYFGNYPSGALLKWNRTQAWTDSKTAAGATSTTNPKLVGYFRSTPAGFHHASCMIQMNDSVLVAAGDVIRIGNTTSIASYDMKHNTWQGYDYNKIIGLSTSSIAKWHDLVLFSTNNGWGGLNPQLYFYNPATNTMVDSMTWGLEGYGQLYIVGNSVIGVASAMIYRIDLNRKIVTDSTRYVTANGSSIMLSDGRIVVGGSNILPAWYKFLNMTNYNYYQIGKNLYGISGYNVVQINGINPQITYPQDSPFQRYLMIKNKN